jgi:hypothetical protein
MTSQFVRAYKCLIALTLDSAPLVAPKRLGWDMAKPRVDLLLTLSAMVFLFVPGTIATVVG